MLDGMKHKLESRINNLRYPDDTTFMAEGEELKECGKVGLKLKIQKTKIMPPGPIT